ncbi:hypothetical protein CSQ86_02375 [Bifidobacterium felsineum]|uniref:DUF559 domain-containing protein n=2 Tax=Bifidobacterium felsineum TaxID=2045440 RepID=A0A2M9HMY7_9BIFI|nr:hypothetical protein [Bifidobacterium felsineum]PJM78182.1 hypothetical protein CSQ86_02375 [Bifidobacterium felsineum]
MRGGLEQRKHDMVRRCAEAARRLGKRLLFGMTTSLILQSIPLPSDCDLDSFELHTVSDSLEQRVRIRGLSIHPHIWKHTSVAEKVAINHYVFALDLFHVWAQLATHVSLDSLIVLGDSIISGIARQPALAKGRIGSAIYADLQRFVDDLAGFKGRLACRRALTLISPGSDSPKESEGRLALRSHGISQPVLNYEVPGIAFRSTAAITLDMAWPEYKVAVEYDGDHHRTDKVQWRRDQEKRDKLRGHQWIVFVATASSLVNADARAEFAFNVARALASRGARFEFFVMPKTVEQLADTALRVRNRG